MRAALNLSRAEYLAPAVQALIPRFPHVEYVNAQTTDEGDSCAVEGREGEIPEPASRQPRRSMR